MEPNDREAARERLRALYADPVNPPFPGAVAMTCSECGKHLTWTNPPLPSVPVVCSQHGRWGLQADT